MVIVEKIFPKKKVRGSLLAMPSEALDPGRDDDKSLLTQVNACSCMG